MSKWHDPGGLIILSKKGGEKWISPPCLYCSGDLFGFFYFSHSVAGALDDDGFAVMQQSIQDGGCEGAVVVEDTGPVFEGFVGGQQDGSAFVAGTDDLEEQVGSCFVDGQVADLIEDEQMRAGIASHGGFEASLLLSGDQVVDRFNGIDVKDFVPVLTGLQCDGGGEVGLADTDRAEQDGVVFVLDEA